MIETAFTSRRRISPNARPEAKRQRLESRDHEAAAAEEWRLNRDRGRHHTSRDRTAPRRDCRREQCRSGEKIRASGSCARAKLNKAQTAKRRKLYAAKTAEKNEKKRKEESKKKSTSMKSLLGMMKGPRKRTAACASDSDCSDEDDKGGDPSDEDEGGDEQQPSDDELAEQQPKENDSSPDDGDEKQPSDDMQSGTSREPPGGEQQSSTERNVASRTSPRGGNTDEGLYMSLSEDEDDDGDEDDGGSDDDGVQFSDSAPPKDKNPDSNIPVLTVDEDDEGDGDDDDVDDNEPVQEDVDLSGGEENKWGKSRTRNTLTLKCSGSASHGLPPRRMSCTGVFALYLDFMGIWKIARARSFSMMQRGREPIVCSKKSS